MKSCFSALLALTCFVCIAAESPRAPLWKQVQDSMDKGLPRSALDALDPIIESARTDRAWPELAKAIGRKVSLEAQIEGRKPEESITRLQAEADRVPPEIQPIFRAFLGSAYWGYFRQNSWRFLQRTALNSPRASDFTTWDLRTLQSEIHRQFQLALQQESLLKSIPVSDFDPLIEKGTVPDTYRPSLYDFLAQRALDFYTAPETGLTKAEDAFEVRSDSPLFASVDEFLRWQPAATTSDTNALGLHGILLHQSLLRFHQTDGDPTALIHADLDRLGFAHRLAADPDKDERYVAALRALSERWPTHPLACRAQSEASAVLHRQGRYVEAHRLASQATNAFPASPWVTDCRNLLRDIESAQLAISTERSWNEPWPALDVRYRNINKVWFRAVKADWDQFLDRRQPRPESMGKAQRLEWLRRPPALEWSADLPPTPDFKQRRQPLVAPASLAPGFYFVFASQKEGFPETDNEISALCVWVSELALVLRSHESFIDGFVLDARTGEPRPGATVETWYLSNNGTRVSIPTESTDSLGYFRLAQAKSDRGHLVRARVGEHQIAQANDLWWHESRDTVADEARNHAILLTDRAIYRPEQIVQFKGITIRLDPAQVRHEILANRDVTVVFRDVNQQEIGRQTFHSSDLGSFSGSFTVPRDRLTGPMSLNAEDGATGSAHFRVEEYKRPKFQVTLEAPTEAPRLNDAVSISGRATAYTGSAVDQAEVSWSVHRQTRFPVWWGWFAHFPVPGMNESRQIAHGRSVTRSDGTFQIAFRALADPAVLESDEPSFHFTVQVAVTEANGETRTSERSLLIGYSAMELALEASDWQAAGQPVAVGVRTQTLDREPVLSRGTLKIHRLEEPSLLFRPPLRPHALYPPDRGVSEIDPSSRIDLSDPNHWKLGPSVLEMLFQTSTNGVATNRFELPAGLYRIIAESQDRFGRRVTARLPLQVLDPGSEKFTLKRPHLVAAPAWEIEPGNEFFALWGTGHESGRAFVEIEHRGKVLTRYWTEPGRTQQRIPWTVTESLRGGFSVRVTQVRDNRAYFTLRDVSVPWTHKELTLSWETFRARLEPGQKETWTAVIKPRRPAAEGTEAARRLATEMVATLYDASLDAIHPHEWPNGFDFWPRFSGSPAQILFSNDEQDFATFLTRPYVQPSRSPVRYRAYPADLQFESPSFRMTPALMARRTGVVAQTAVAPAMASAEGMPAMAFTVADGAPMPKGVLAGTGAPPPATEPPPAGTGAINPRRNLNETAFFLPHLAPDSNGWVRISFTLPEALTEWRFLGLAHDRELRSGALQGKAITAKEIMVQPNPPRFLREGDELEFTAKISNQSNKPQSGSCRLSLALTSDNSPADALFANAQPEVSFSIPSKESKVVRWRLRVPDGAGFLTYKVVAVAEHHTDGEEGFLPVLSRRILVTESLPISIRGPATNLIEFARLKAARVSPTLRHQSLTVQMASNPAWYAVLALPYLMEFPHDGSEQVFNRLYANALARHIATSDPRIRQIFDAWRGTDALDSPLEKNPELKAIALAETPWVRDARSESEARRNVGVLFDGNRLESETDRALRKLQELQLTDGSWPWFPGGNRNEYISLYLVAGFGRLRDLGVPVSLDLATRALAALDASMNERYEGLKRENRLEHQNLDSTVALYLYARSFFAKSQPVAREYSDSMGYWLRQAREHWLKTERQTQAHIAIAFARLGNDTHPDAVGTAQAITRSIKEHSVVSQELGRYWRDEEMSWWWYRAPVETQALMIELFHVVTHDADAVAECRTWLLNQKQTQNWKSTKATADAVYALLLGGPPLLDNGPLVRVELGGRDMTPRPSSRDPQGSAVEPGTGYHQVQLAGPEIVPSLGDIRVRRENAGVSWGAVHWQYFEDLSQVQASTRGPLNLSKTLFVRTQSAKGARLQPVSGELKVGDEVVVHLILRTDRDMEYLHLKDLRGSGMEPSSVLSQYRFQDGLGYYESSRDTASHYFIERLPRGTYVFEYSLRVQHRGTYPTGVAEIQCLYAPEFNSHSESIPVVAR